MRKGDEIGEDGIGFWAPATINSAQSSDNDVSLRDTCGQVCAPWHGQTFHLRLDRGNRVAQLCRL